MGELIKYFYKLSLNLKVKVSTIIAGLLLPSLIVVVFNFPDIFFSYDFVKLFVVCIIINFSNIFVLTLITVLVNIFLLTYRRKFITGHNDILDRYVKQYKNKIKYLRLKLESNGSETDELTEATEYITEKMLRYKRLLNNYADSFLNLSNHVFYISINIIWR